MSIYPKTKEASIENIEPLKSLQEGDHFRKVIYVFNRWFKVGLEFEVVSKGARGTHVDCKTLLCGLAYLISNEQLVFRTQTKKESVLTIEVEEHETIEIRDLEYGASFKFAKWDDHGFYVELNTKGDDLCFFRGNVSQNTTCYSTNSSAEAIRIDSRTKVYQVL